jgi:hypothetical protein
MKDAYHGNPVFLCTPIAHMHLSCNSLYLCFPSSCCILTLLILSSQKEIRVELYFILSFQINNFLQTLNPSSM